MPLLRIERNGKVLSIKKANRKEEEKRDESNVLGPATNSTQYHQIEIATFVLFCTRFERHHSTAATPCPGAPSWPATMTTPIADGYGKTKFLQPYNTHEAIYPAAPVRIPSAITPTSFKYTMKSSTCWLAEHIIRIVLYTEYYHKRTTETLTKI